MKGWKPPVADVENFWRLAGAAQSQQVSQVSPVLQVIFRYALAVFKYKEDDILKICDSVEIYQYLRFFTKTISDGR